MTTIVSKKTEQPKQTTAWRYTKAQRLFALVGALLCLLVGSTLIAGGVYVSSLLGMIAYDDGPNDYADVPMLPGDVDDGSVTNVIEDPKPVDIRHIELRGDTDAVTNVMLLGVDGRQADGYTARSDTNMILSINTETETIKLVSLMRDLWVTVPSLDLDGDGYADHAKLNAAFYYGGFPLLSETLEENFKLSVKRYVAVDFAAFEKAVDALGGVDIALSQEEAAFIPKTSDDPDAFATPDHPELEPLGNKAGVYHLNGQQALAYCRIRDLYEDSDFDRQSNQRTVINELIKKAKTLHFAALTNALSTVLPYVQTNFSKQELLSLAARAMRYASYTIETDRSVPSSDGGYEDAWIGDGLGLWLTDPEQTTLDLHRYLYS